MLNRLFVVDSVTLTSTGTAVSTYTPWDQTTRKLPTQVVVKATGQGAYVRLSNDNSAATNADVLVQGGDHVVLSVQGRRWVSVLSDGASSTVNVGALSTGVSGSAASLDLVFVDAGVLDPRVTFTRASTATYFNSAGVLTSAAINESRRDFDPATLAVRGLLIEEQRTNSIRNNTMQGAVVGTPGTVPTNWNTFTTLTGLTREVVGTGTENGITYIDIKLSGTPSAAGGYTIYQEASTGVAALSGQTWTISQYLKLQGGSLTGISPVRLYFQENNSGGGYLTEQQTTIANPTSAALSTQRSSATRTLTNASTAFLSGGLTLGLTGAAIDITLRIGLPQLELGAFATSVIPTTTTALTRSADVASVNTLSPWFNATAGTMYAETQLANIVAQNRMGFDFHDGSSNNRNVFRALTTGGADQNSVRSGNVSVAVISSSVSPTTAIRKTAIVFEANDFAITADGAVPNTDTSGAVPVGLTTLLLGSGLGNSEFLGGWIRRFTFYPRKFSSAEMQAITV